MANRGRAPRFAALFGGDFGAFRDSFVALLIAAFASLAAGLTLASVIDTLEELPGLLLLVPAAIAVKGNISVLWAAASAPLSMLVRSASLSGWNRRLVRTPLRPWG